MLHYFLTGEADSKTAAIDLGRWVLAMDDGHRTVFRHLAGGATGLASSTASTDYHGPGRGAGNSILACMTAYRLTGEPPYLNKARELIRRCAGPRDDFDALNLRHIESRWSYTVSASNVASASSYRLCGAWRPTTWTLPLYSLRRT